MSTLDIIGVLLLISWLVELIFWLQTRICSYFWVGMKVAFAISTMILSIERLFFN